MGGEIKSALEIALEKAEKLGTLTDEERLKWKYFPEGEKLAAKYLKQDVNLVAELSQYPDEAKKYVIAGASEVLIRNISLPKNDLAKRNNKKAMEGLKTLKSDKVSVENVYSRLRRIFDHYVTQGEEQRKQAYESLKAEFEARVQEAVRQQLGSFIGVKIDVEKQPQFQEEWYKLHSQLDSQYLKLLDECKQELSTIP
jgi:formate dehydrogenase maturation protein FdhE